MNEYYLYFWKLYFFRRSNLVSSSWLVKYAIQPGQKLMCQRQKRPRTLLGFLSYFALKRQVSQGNFCSAIILYLNTSAIVFITNLDLSVRPQYFSRRVTISLFSSGSPALKVNSYSSSSDSKAFP